MNITQLHKAIRRLEVEISDYEMVSREMFAHERHRYELLLCELSALRALLRGAGDGD